MLRIVLTGEVEDETVAGEWRRGGAQLEFVAINRVVPTIRAEPDLQADCLVSPPRTARVRALMCPARRSPVRLED